MCIRCRAVSVRWRTNRGANARTPIGGVRAPSCASEQTTIAAAASLRQLINATGHQTMPKTSSLTDIPDAAQARPAAHRRGVGDRRLFGGPRDGAQAPERLAGDRTRLRAALPPPPLHGARHSFAERGAGIPRPFERGAGTRRRDRRTNGPARRVARLRARRTVRPEPRRVRGGRYAGEHDPRGPGGGADRHRQLSRLHPVPGRAGPDHASNAGGDPGDGRGARRRPGRPAGGVSR